MLEGYQCCSENRHYLSIDSLIYWGICQCEQLSFSLRLFVLVFAKAREEKSLCISRRLNLLQTSNSAGLIPAWNMPQHEMRAGFEDSSVSSAIWKIMWYSVCKGFMAFRTVINYTHPSFCTGWAKVAPGQTDTEGFFVPRLAEPENAKLTATI